MSRTFLVPLLLVSAVLVVSACSSSTAPKRETELRKALPPGSSLADVESYLTQHNIEHSPLDVTNRIGAMIRDDRKTAIILEDRSIEFGFDENKKLTSITSQPSRTGP
jgi:hypothetical protein